MNKKIAKRRELEFNPQDLLIDSDSGSDEELKKTEEQQVIRILEQARAREQSIKGKKTLISKREEDVTKQFFQTSNFNSSKGISSNYKTKSELSKPQKIGRWNQMTGTYEKYNGNEPKIYKLQKYDPVYLEERSDPFAPIIPDLNSNRKPKKLFFSLKNNNSESQKSAFSEFLTYYRQSTSKSPTVVFEYKNKFSEEKMIRKLPSTKSEATLNKNSNILIENNIFVGDNSKQKSFITKPGYKIVPMISSLIELEKILFDKTKISKFVDEIPRIELLEWKDILKELNAFKIDIVIIDPIRFHVENQFEFKSESQEAYVTIGEQRHVFMKKFIFSVQSNHKFAKGLKDEKEIMLYYQIIIGIINQNIKEITISNLSLDEILELAKEKASFIIKGNDIIPPYIEDWITKKIDHMISYEISIKNNGRITKANKTFDIREYYLATYKKSKKQEDPIPKSTIQDFNNFVELSKESTNLLAYEPIQGKTAKRLKLIPNPINITDFPYTNTEDKDKGTIREHLEIGPTSLHKKYNHLIENTSPQNLEGKFRINNITPFRDSTYLDSRSPKQNILVSGSLSKDKSTYRVQKVFL